MLKVRILTAVILGLGLLVSLFLLPARWTVVVFAAVFTLAAWEWSGFGALHSRAARAAYTLGITALLAICWRWTEGAAHLLLLLELACLWWVAALVWLSLAPGRHRPAVALACGVPVLVPAFIALARVLLASRGFARGPEMLLWMLLMERLFGPAGVVAAPVFYAWLKAEWHIWDHPVHATVPAPVVGAVLAKPVVRTVQPVRE